MRSNNGAKMTPRRVKECVRTVGTRPLFIEPGSPWENGYCGSFNGKLRVECLNGEIFYSLRGAQEWRLGCGGRTTTPCVRTARWDTGRRPVELGGCSVTPNGAGHF